MNDITPMQRLVWVNVVHYLELTVSSTNLILFQLK